MKSVEPFLELYIGVLLITVNLYFFTFVHYKSDLSPNFALAIMTIPPAIYQIIKVMKTKPQKKQEVAE